MFKKEKNNFKTYVISDVHSHFGVFERFLNDINPEDKVFFLGDAIDKGPDGIEVLKYIMDNPRIQMVMGNHELMMIQYLHALDVYKEGIETKMLDVMDKYMLSGQEEQWLDRNCGWATLEGYFKLSKEEQKKMIEFLINLPLVLRVDVNNRNFVLVHSVPARIPFYTPGAILYLEHKHRADDYVWDRLDSIEIENSIIVVGHTMTYHYGAIDENGKMTIASANKVNSDGQEEPVWFDIDCGLAKNSTESRLCALCLDDLSVKYYELEENERIDINKDPEEFVKEYYDNKEKEIKEYLNSI